MNFKDNINKELEQIVYRYLEVNFLDFLAAIPEGNIKSFETRVFSKNDEKWYYDLYLEDNRFTIGFTRSGIMATSLIYIYMLTPQQYRQMRRDSKNCTRILKVGRKKLFMNIEMRGTANAPDFCEKLQAAIDDAGVIKAELERRMHEYSDCYKKIQEMKKALG